MTSDDKTFVLSTFAGGHERTARALRTSPRHARAAFCALVRARHAVVDKITLSLVVNPASVIPELQHYAGVERDSSGVLRAMDSAAGVLAGEIWPL